MSNFIKDIIKPVASISSLAEFEIVFQSEEIKEAEKLENTLISSDESFTVEGYCSPCEKDVSFLVDMEFGGKCVDSIWIPNWRERLECPYCKMNSRQRLMSALIKQTLDTHDKNNVYFMEQVTPIFKWVASSIKNHNIVGSEYLGYEYGSGDIINGIRHEDIENLSFEDDELDLIVSNDVFEHVPNPKKAFLECSRVLKEGGVMIATIPFFANSVDSVTRAKLNGDVLEHVLPPEYHGNPISDNGSLVFTDFGWDILHMFTNVGFAVSVEFYSSIKFGHLGDGQIVFRCIKNVAESGEVQS